MLRREIHVGGARLEHRKGPRVGERDQPSTAARERPSSAVTISGLRARGEPLRRLLDPSGIGVSPALDLPARRRRDGQLAERLGQHLAREREVDGPARLSHRELERAIHHRLQLGGLAELVVPLDVLAQHAGLVEGLLRPVDVRVARARQRAVLGDGGAARGEQDRDLRPRRVDDGAGAVRRPHRDMDHHRLGPAGDQVVAVSHRDRDELVRHGDRARSRLSLGLRSARRRRRSTRSPCQRWRRSSRCRDPAGAPGTPGPPSPRAEFSSSHPRLGHPVSRGARHRERSPRSVAEAAGGVKVATFDARVARMLRRSRTAYSTSRVAPSKREPRRPAAGPRERHAQPVAAQGQRRARRHPGPACGAASRRRAARSRAGREHREVVRLAHGRDERHRRHVEGEQEEPAPGVTREAGLDPEDGAEDGRRRRDSAGRARSRGGARSRSAPRPA